MVSYFLFLVEDGVKHRYASERKVVGSIRRRRGLGSSPT